jgi:hypothetical protein
MDFDSKVDKIWFLRHIKAYTYFTVLHLNDKFAAQIYLDQNARIKTAFKTPDGRFFCYNTIPPGLKNAHLTVKRTCDRVLRDNPDLGRFAIRLDRKLILLANDLSESQSNFELLCERFGENNIKMDKLDKLQDQDNLTEIEVFDSVVSKDKVVPNPKKLSHFGHLKICQTNAQFNLFKNFLASLSSLLPDFFSLNSEFESLGRNVFTDQSVANKPLTYSKFSECFEKIKRKISNLINSK